jgi:hypothetical protein
MEEYPPLPNNKIKDIRGKTFGSLYCVSFENVIKTHSHWKFICTCGKVKVMDGSRVRRHSFPTCGCKGWRGEYIEIVNGEQIRDLSNMRFGKLKAIKLLDKTKRGNKEWECICDCGKTHNVIATCLISGKTTGCGCSTGSPKDISGMRFGKLIAAYPTRQRQGRQVLWYCDCDCGNSTQVIQSHLSNGTTKSCGCGMSSHDYGGIKNKDRKTLSFMRITISTAKKRNIKWELSFDDLRLLIFSSCFYCGKQPMLDSSGLVRNGIDRYNSSDGYIKNNCVPCCAICNLAKRTLHGDDFIALCKRITALHSEKIKDNHE